MSRRRERRPLRRPSGPSWVTWANLAMMAVVLIVVILSRGPVADAVNSMFEQVASEEGSGEGSGAEAAESAPEPTAGDAVRVATQRVRFATQLAQMQSNRDGSGDGATER